MFPQRQFFGVEGCDAMKSCRCLSTVRGPSC